MAEMQIQIGAEVNGAIRGLQQVETQANKTFQKVAQTSNQAGTAVGNLSRIVQDAPFGFIAISNNLQPLFDDFTRLKGQTGSIGGALKSLGGALTGPAGIGLAFAAATSLITIFSKELFGSGKAAEKTKTDADKLKESINGVFSETAKEAASVSSLVSVLRSDTESRERKLAAIKQLQQIQPEIFSGLKLEGETVLGLDSAYQKYIANLQNVITAKIKQAQLEQAVEKLLKLQGTTLTADEKKYKAFGDAIGKAYQKQIAGSVAGAQATERSRRETEKETKQIQLLQEEIETLNRDLTELSSGVKVQPIKIEKADTGLLVSDLVKQIQNSVKDSKIKFERLPQIITPEYVKGIQNVLDVNPIELKLQPIDPKTIIDANAYRNQLKVIEKANNLLAESVTGVVKTAFGQLFDALKNGENAFRAFAQGVGTALLSVVEKIIATAAAAAVLSFIFPGGIGGATGFKNIFGSLIGLRANGGPVTGSSPYIVGERGPELFVPSVSGNVIPNNRLSSFNGRPAFAGGMGGRSIVRGSDILLSYARTQRSQSRVNG